MNLKTSIKRSYHYFLLFFLFILVFKSKHAFAQVSEGELHGNVDILTQIYNSDLDIGAPDVPEKFRMNAFSNVIYTKGKFSAGIRFESYQNAILGFNENYKGNGIPYRFARYQLENLDITVGNFYEQFGNGQILRAYEERGLGIDNAFDGVRVKMKVLEGIYLKGLVGQQRNYFDMGEGIVRAFDGEFVINEMFGALADKKTNVAFGGSLVSKYQEDRNPNFTLPENVMAWSSRASVFRGGFSFSGEYTYKFNDPSVDNGFIYKNGETLFLSGSYSTKGFGINLSAKHVDNMFFRSDRNNNSVFNDLLINYVPALTKQHTYNLAATLYPYATQPMGEVAYQADVLYRIPKNSWLGGKYGASLAINYSIVNNIDTTRLNDLGTNDLDNPRLGYSTKFFSRGERLYFQDFNVEFTRKFSKSFKLTANYLNFIYDQEIVQGLGGKPVIFANIAIVDALYKINPKHAIRTEAQALFTDQDEGDWATLLVEYTYSPHWFVAVLDQFNYGNPDPNKRFHYPYASVGYMNKSNRITVSYGRQRAGIFCVGGVCRVVPASNGLSLAITSSF